MSGGKKTKAGGSYRGNAQANKWEVFYHYDAAGNKLAKYVQNGTTYKTTDYIANLVYTDGQKSFFSTEEGRAIPIKEGSDTHWHFEYNLKDHLGNNRVTFGGSMIPGGADIVQTSSYYPFGLVMEQKNYNSATTNYQQNKYLYNGKEIQDDDLGGVSLDWYDYGARFYDPSLGRFHTVDPLADDPINISFTPYHYVGNNPIIFIDPDGKKHIPVNNVLSHYGYESKEKQLFPSSSTYQKTVKALNVVKNILDPSAPVWLAVVGETYQAANEAKDGYYKDPGQADRKNVESYYKNLTEIDATISGKIDEVNKSIEDLRAEEAESGNTGFNNEEIASQTKLKWDLEYEQISVQSEIKSIKPIIESPEIIKN